MNAHHWLYWIAAFVIVLAVLVVATAVQEALAWRKENRK